jgi:superfamily II RNA helicase
VGLEAPLLEKLPPLGEKLVSTDEVMDRFIEYTMDLGIELYSAQEEALLEILAGKNIILNTPTGSGKSLVALAMHFLAMCEDKRSVYTSPVKALVNEKFFALCEAFHPDNVGLMTGDATVNRDAPIICCTAEILANQGLREGEDADVQYAILDEFHYYGDRDRGVAWQIPLLTMPQTRFLLMSATLGDMKPFEDRLTELNGHATAIVTSNQRPVPLTYHYFETALHESVSWLIDQDEAPIYIVNFTQKGCHTEAQNLMSVNVCTKQEKKAIGRALEGFRFDTPYGKTIRRFVRHGIGIHHGGMLPKYRRLVERLAKGGHLKVISGTDTLGVGVNIPIRSVLLTKLCKFDGRKTRILSVRDFKQICGRAGRKGYDDHGTVVVQAPEHVVENKKLEAKAANDPKKRRKMVKKKPPDRGYVHWTKDTFNRLVKGKPEPLKSRFRVSHAMLLNVLSREHGGCSAMKQLLRDCHDRDAVKHRHAKTAIKMFRSLVEADIVSLEAVPGHGYKRAQVNVDLQQEFSLNYSLSLYVVQTLRVIDEELETYPLEVLSLVEAILEDPTIILRKQLDRIKGEAVARMKAEGMEYDERMEELEKLEYPKPNASFIYGTFDEFTRQHPWVAHDNIRPKGVARELYESAQDLRSYVVDYKLERAEGTVLRYFSDVYKALVQTVPSWARTPEVEDMTDFFGGVVRGVDASLIDEWETLRDPSYVPRPEIEEVEEKEEEVARRGITGDERAFTVLVRNAVFRVVKALAGGHFEAAASEIDAADEENAWTPERLETALSPYFEDHEHIRTDPRARGTEHTLIDKEDGRWRVRQKLVDPDEHNDWMLDITIDLDASDEASRPVLVLHHLGS